MEESTLHGCCAPGCMLNIKIAKRHFFKFPKEKERWLEWIKACDRMDLITEGPEYANRNCRLCHLHFRVELFRNIEGKIYLNKEAVPSIFLKPIQPGHNYSGQFIQPVSFVTIFLKPESRSRHSLESVTSTQSLSQTLAEPETKDTAIISPLQALFPRATIKQACDDSIIPSSQTTLLRVEKLESNKENVSMDVQPVKETTVNSAVSTSRILPKKTCVDADIIDLTATDSWQPTPPPTKTSLPKPTSPKASSPKTSERIRWHACTQTPDAWLHIDIFLRKRSIENSETCAESTAAKRRKTLTTEDYRAILDDFKAAYAELLPRNSSLVVLASIIARERRKNGRTFEDRQFALKLFFMAPSAYRFYRSLCSLPTVRQLWAHIRNWDIPPGLNDNVLNALRLKMKSLPPIHRHCCLCMKEMQLRPHLFYNVSRDRIIGFHNTGTEKRRTLARKVLVLIARGLAGDWQQPVAYYFHGGACSAGVVRNLISHAVTKLKSIGVPVHALVTSTASTFLRLSRQLRISAERPFFQVDNENVVFFVFDVPRLIRATRNVLMKYDLQFHDKRASWADIEQFFKYDSQLQVPLSELSTSHFVPNAHQKTETKYAAEVFSYRVASGLSAHFAAGRFPLQTIGTIELVHNFEQLFEFLNFSTPSDRNPRDTRGSCHAFTGNMHELSFLHGMLDFLRAIKVIGRNGARVKLIKCFDRWQITINAIIQLWDVLRNHQFSFLNTKRLTQEGVEHIFRSIRRQSGNRARPTPIMFTRAFKNLVSKHFLEHTNEDDSDVNTRRMLKRLASASFPDVVSPAVAPIPLSVATTNYYDIDLRLPERSAFRRVCEFLLNECLRAHDCELCAAYAAKEGKDAPGFSLYVTGLEDTFMRNFEELAIEENLGAQMLHLAEQIKYKPPCPNFPVAFLVKLFLRMRIYFTLSRHNKICKTSESHGSFDVIKL